VNHKYEIKNRNMVAIQIYALFDHKSELVRTYKRSYDACKALKKMPKGGFYTSCYLCNPF